MNAKNEKTEPGSFANAVDSLKNAVADFSSLTVTTYTGDLSVLLTKGQKDGSNPYNLNNLDFQKILEASLEAGVEGKFKLACFNCYHLDGDGIAFRSDDIPEAKMSKLEAAHSAALVAGRETREGVLNLVKETVSSVFGIFRP